MFRRLAAGLAVALGCGLAIAGAFLISPFHEAGAGTSSDSSPPAANVEQLPAPPAPQLTDQQISAARSAVAATPALSGMAHAAGVSMLVVPWYSESGDLLGAGVDVRWKTPISVSATWPSVAYDQTETIKPPYQTTTARVRASNVKGVHAYVDLSGHRVIGVEPLPGADISEFTPDESKIHLPPQPQTAQ